MVRRSTLKAGERKPKKTKEEEKELIGDVEGKSFFKCPYSRFHQGEDAPPIPPALNNSEEDTYAASRVLDDRRVNGCPTCQVQIKE